jgi:hypothetical protein
VRLLPVLLLALAQMAPQNPSPMSESTRPHPRVARYDVPGHRATLSIGTLYLPPRFNAARPFPLLVHFHGAPWLIEHHVRERWPAAALVTVQIGSGSRVYAEAFADPTRFPALLEEVSTNVTALAGTPARRESIALSSFSAGYGAIRAILGHPQHAANVNTVVLADSLHASYRGDPSAQRSTDLPIDETSLEPFLKFADDAAAGRKRLWVSHSEVYPGTYASTTETADALLRHVQLPRRPRLNAGSVGMQQLSETRRGGLYVAGFAGNSAPDHLDHLYALGDVFKRIAASR